MKLLVLISTILTVYRAESALVASLRQPAEENLSPRFQQLRDSGQTLENKILQRAQSLRELKEQNVIEALKTSTVLNIGPRRNSVSEGSCLKNVSLEANKQDN